MESSSTDWGGRITNHLPVRPAVPICRAIKIARTTFDDGGACVRRPSMPSSRSKVKSLWAVADHQDKPHAFLHRAAPKGGAETRLRQPEAASATTYRVRHHQASSRAQRTIGPSFYWSKSISVGPTDTRKATHRFNIERPQRMVTGGFFDYKNVVTNQHSQNCVQKAKAKSPRHYKLETYKMGYWSPYPIIRIYFH